MLIFIRLFINSLHEWSHRQCGCLVYGWLRDRFPAEGAPICTVQVPIREYCFAKYGVIRLVNWIYTISDDIVCSRMWSTATRCFPLLCGCFTASSS